MPAQDAEEHAARTTAVPADAESQAPADHRPLIDGQRIGAGSPLGGFKQSGMGRRMGVAGMGEFVKRMTYPMPVTGGSA